MNSIIAFLILVLVILLMVDIDQERAKLIDNVVSSCHDAGFFEYNGIIWTCNFEVVE